jgi:lysyl-tRNA synthetase class 2
VLRNIRAFFDQRAVLEVETSLLSSASTTDPSLNSFGTHYNQHDLYLNTSPEYCMKRLLAAFGEPIYQVCKSFRDDELGPHHNPEFTLLEWYRPGFNMFELMDELADLVRMLVLHNGPGRARFQKLRYADVYQQAVGINPHATTAEECRCRAIEHGLQLPVGLEDNIDEWLDWLLIERVMPSLPADRFTFIYDYPASQAALAKLHQNEQGDTVAARFELFCGQMELANGFDELLNADEQRQRFEHENAQRRRQGLRPSVIDEELLAALAYGLPRCSGVALGLDRLLMLLSGTNALNQVLAFAFCRI